ncbi:hypothetical protein NBRC116588_12090 [Pyruvatibacter sp. HU-CL02332]|uniref:hypothetical protein n=1 Tax=Pyruvatibacter sp. HU-CL02332 TaxID=3127650 RepID=UPI0031088D62
MVFKSGKISLFALGFVLAGSSAASAQEPARNITVDPSLTTLSVPHLQACQQGFEAIFGIPDGMDPDESLIIRGARQSYFQDQRFGDQFKSTLEIAMPYERVLPPGPPDGAVIPGRITCSFVEREDNSFATTPDVVAIEEEGVTRTLSNQERRLFQ